MKVLFLIVVFIPFIFTVHAQRQFSQYTCSLSHKYSETSFYLAPGELKQVEVGGWKVYAGLKKLEKAVEVSLTRKVNVLDASYRKEEKKSYPLNARMLPVKLAHSFGGRTDVFNMVCYPRDP